MNSTSIHNEDINRIYSVEEIKEEFNVSVLYFHQMFYCMHTVVIYSYSISTLQ